MIHHHHYLHNLFYFVSTLSYPPLLFVATVSSNTDESVLKNQALFVLLRSFVLILLVGLCIVNEKQLLKAENACLGLATREMVSRHSPTSLFNTLCLLFKIQMNGTKSSGSHINLVGHCEFQHIGECAQEIVLEGIASISVATILHEFCLSSSCY